MVPAGKTNATWCVASVLIGGVALAANPALAICNVGVPAPVGLQLYGASQATNTVPGKVTVGPGGPVYIAVKNNGPSASIGIYFRRQGANLVNSFCSQTTLLQTDDEYWLEARYAGDDLTARDLDVVTAENNANLEVRVYKAPNLLPPSITETLTFRMRAFIPSSTSTPGYVRPVPGVPQQSMIPGPKATIAGVPLFHDEWCYLTDNRVFSDVANASARVATEFKLVVYHGQVSIEPATASRIHRGGVSTKINCSTGATLERKTAEFLPPFGVRALGNVSAADSRLQIVGQASIGNPHFTKSIAGVDTQFVPMIDYAFDVIYDTKAKNLSYSLSFGSFPAFEMYVARGSGRMQPVITHSPTADSVWGLIDGGIGLQTIVRKGTITIQ